MTSDQNRRLEMQIRTLQLIRLELTFARDRLRILRAGAGLPRSEDSGPGLREDQAAAPADLPGEVGGAPLPLQR